MELSARWVPQHMQMMDGGYRHTARFNGESTQLSLMPSEYFQRQVRVAAFSYERPLDLMAASGDLFMACSDYPHTEGTLTAIEDYAAVGLAPDAHPQFFGGNASFLLREPAPIAGRRECAVIPLTIRTSDSRRRVSRGCSKRRSAHGP